MNTPGTRQVTFEIEINDDGDAVIRLPEGPGQQRDANAVAPLTERIAKAIGTLKERHVGDHEHHTHNHLSSHHQNHQNAGE